MYNSGPDVDDEIDLKLLHKFIETIDLSRIGSWGIYGGEPSIAMDGFGLILSLLPEGTPRIPRFVITNGAWSTDPDETDAFLTWCARNKLFIVVSGTPEHRLFQERWVLVKLRDYCPEGIRLKPEEEQFHPMGRLAGAFPVSCNTKCMWWDKPLRIAVQPDGSIIFQNCNGVYPVVGNIREDFATLHRNVQKLRKWGFQQVCPHYPKGTP
jgi:hypothetical protein